MCGLREGAQLILPSVKDDGKEDIIRHYENLLDLNVLRGGVMRRPPGRPGAAVRTISENRLPEPGEGLRGPSNKGSLSRAVSSGGITDEGSLSLGGEAAENPPNKN